MSAAALVRGGDVTVVGGGWSVANVAVDQLAGRVIAVNDSAVHLRRWDFAVSMDRLWAENRLERVVKIAWDLELRDGSMLARASVAPKLWIRENALQNLPKLVGTVTPFRCDHETDEFALDQARAGVARLNGRSSGTCALNLAWHLRPSRLFLLGFDMNRSPSGDPYWYPPYPWSTPAGSTTNGKYQAWAKGFDTIRDHFHGIGCPVFNVSPQSAIATFQKITPTEYLRLTR
jgi:hypothetical protein